MLSGFTSQFLSSSTFAPALSNIFNVRPFSNAASAHPSLAQELGSECKTPSSETCITCPQFSEESYNIDDLSAGSIVCCSCGCPHSSNKSKPFDFFCVSCHHLMPPKKDASFFQLLGLVEKFKMDLKSLEKRYRKLQMHVHPDKFHSNGGDQLEMAEEHSSILNTAYWTLRDPEQRAFYMLSRRGFDISEEHMSKQVPLDPMFLMEVMETRETIEEAPAEAMAGMLSDVDRDIATRVERLGELLDNGQDKEAFEMAVQLRYMNQIRRELYERV
ncbi:Co-chaperone Hsc20 [Carpediemonas membranifera]|uniref:Co-chaperone Hsc20 n=1 Tax=Carpediemonas membranifera TaxID=201153 RepID=A0A8J6AZW4_9EUKA|nr:Co-chaperone Hsc20 [Carpediemonas membranifera]|eukprot:KAG9392478.1 Co-chaperone Hsc20 [Carpediemonas membranifera]